MHQIYFLVAFFFSFFPLGRVLPVVPLKIFPRFVLLSPLPIVFSLW